MLYVLAVFQLGLRHAEGRDRCSHNPRRWLLAISGGLVGIALTDRRERTRWLRDSQLQTSTSLLSALQRQGRHDRASASDRDDEHELAPQGRPVVYKIAAVRWSERSGPARNVCGNVPLSPVVRGLGCTLGCTGQ